MTAAVTAPTTHGVQSRVGFLPPRRSRRAGTAAEGPRVGVATSAPDAERVLWPRDEPDGIALGDVGRRVRRLDDDGPGGVVAVDEVADDAAEEQLAPHDPDRAVGGVVGAQLYVLGPDGQDGAGLDAERLPLGLVERVEAPDDDLAAGAQRDLAARGVGGDDRAGEEVDLPDEIGDEQRGRVAVDVLRHLDLHQAAGAEHADAV